MQTLLEPADIDRWRQALNSAGYDLDQVTARLTEATMTAIARGDYRAALAATGGGDPQATLIRLFLCGLSEPEAAVKAAFAPLALSAAVDGGILIAGPDGYRAGMALSELYGEHRVLSDLPASLGGTVDSEHVLGVGGASTSLAGYMIRRPVETALDVGTGCGVQALHLSGHADAVTATDVSSRGLAFAATNAALNGLSWELLAGDMLAPVAGRRFDQVVSNPPFIVGPGKTDFTYRDSGRAGDGVCAELARAAPELLNPGGTLQFLANWVHVKGQSWSERVAGWFEGSGCDVWAIQRDVCDPLDYVRIWQRDADENHDPQRLAEWLEWFDRNEIEAVGFGVVNARRTGSAAPTVVCEDIRHRPVAPFGELITRWFDTLDLLSGTDAMEFLAKRPRLAAGVQLHQEAAAGPQGWEVERQILVDTLGLCRREEVDPLLVSFLAGCTGDVEMRTLVGLLAQAHEAPEALLAASLSSVARGLVQRGFLTIG